MSMNGREVVLGIFCQCFFSNEYTYLVCRLFIFADNTLFGGLVAERLLPVVPAQLSSRHVAIIIYLCIKYTRDLVWTPTTAQL